MSQAALIPEGQVTAKIYGLIKDQLFDDAIMLLDEFRQAFSKSRAALSLLAYCYYSISDFGNASECYAELAKLFPEAEYYKIYHSQCLYKACLFEDAMLVARQIDSPDAQLEVTKLKAAIKYGERDLSAARSLLEECPPDDADTQVNEACVLFAESEYDKALEKFTDVFNTYGYSADLSYNMALCHYRNKQYAPALNDIATIIERGIRDHSELSVGMATELDTKDFKVKSVGNTMVLAETALIEAFNLKSAIEYQLRNVSAALEALTDMPPRSEEELDAVTLHNTALMNMETDPTAGFEKLQYLLQQNPCPPETFGNLLLLYCKYEHYDLAADVMAENFNLTYTVLNPYVYDFLDATITQQTSAEEGFRKFDIIANTHAETLRKLTKQVQDARHAADDDEVKRMVNKYDEALERYIPVLMAQAKIYWDLKNYSQVEILFRKSVEFCNEHDVWKLNVAHVLFMQSVQAGQGTGGQEAKYKEAIGFYEPIVKKNYDGLLDVSAIVLANTCVSYIMTSQNEIAEELMRKIEKEEEAVAYDSERGGPDKKTYHLCIVNLVIGTLYCAKGNFEFGMSRVIKSLDPFSKKLGTQTWFYAKRCFCALIEQMAKQMITINDQVMEDIIEFLEMAEVHGRTTRTVEENPLETKEAFEEGRETVTYEARVLKDLILRLA